MSQPKSVQRFLSEAPDIAMKPLISKADMPIANLSMDEIEICSNTCEGGDKLELDDDQGSRHGETKLIIRFVF